MARLDVKIGELTLKNPVTTASGTFGYGTEYIDFMDLGKLGGIFVKGTTIEPRQGNDYPRMAETPSGMLNSVGLQNKGVDYFVEHLYPVIKEYDTHMMVNVSGSTVEDYVACAEKLADLEKMPAIELNISCPNVKEGGMAFGTSCRSVESRRPMLSTITGGLSGPCIKPIAVRMVWEVFRAVNVPIIGMGGICTWQDAVEFILAGAAAIQVGTYNFIDPAAPIKILEGINNYLDRHGFASVNDLVGQMQQI